MRPIPYSKKYLLLKIIHEEKRSQSLNPIEKKSSAYLLRLFPRRKKAFKVQKKVILSGFTLR